MIAKCLWLVLAVGTLATYEWKENGTFKDGATVAQNWTCLWLGYGTGEVKEGQLWLRPAAASQGVTHSGLVRSNFALGPTWDIAVTVATDAQFRTARSRRKGSVAAPNPWEAAWLVTEMTEDGSAGLYFILKTNGVELGAYAQGGAAARYLFTSDKPRLVLGQPYQCNMVKDSQGVAVWLDGKLVAAAPISSFAAWPLGDRIGLYTEDAAVRFGPVTLR